MANVANDLLAAMLEPQTYPHPVQDLRHLETHISHVFLTGEFAYKIKKPIRNPFLDYTTLELRKRYCQAELQLNKRFAPDLYLGVVAVARDSAGWNLEGRGEVVEFAVQMREFAQESLLLSKLRAGKLTREMVRSLGVELAAIHGAAPRLPDLNLPYGSLATIAQDSADNFTSLQGLLNAEQKQVLARLQLLVASQLQKIGEAIGWRRAAGFVRECHGDLHLGNLIWHGGRVQLFDGIEFNESFRWIDVMSDLGFVLMDLAEHGQAGLANELLNAYLQESGDFAGLNVLPFYLVYRALVRAKVAAMRAAQQTEAERSATRRELDDYLQYARRELEPHPPLLVLTHGVSGSGKTYQTEKLLGLPRLIRIRSDVERKRQAGLPATVAAAESPSQGMYSSTQRSSVYEQLKRLAGLVLGAGFSVVVDATFLQAEHRRQFQQLATELGVPWKILHFEASREELRARLERREQLGRDASDANEAVLLTQLADYVPLSPFELEACTTVERLCETWSQ